MENQNFREDVQCRLKLFKSSSVLEEERNSLGADTSVILKRIELNLGQSVNIKFYGEEETVWKYSAGNILKSNGVPA